MCHFFMAPLRFVFFPHCMRCSVRVLISCVHSNSKWLPERLHRPSADSARFLIAAIGGAVVGLFNNFTIGQGASIPPLAIAFLVGYAVDVFFTFLEGMLQAFTRKTSGAAPPQSA